MNKYLIGLTCLVCGSILCEILDILLQKHIERNIKEKYIKFSKSKWARIRKYCAFYGYELEKLQHDKKWEVRIEVVRKKYNVERFLNDKHICVREEARKVLNK